MKTAWLVADAIALALDETGPESQSLATSVLLVRLVHSTTLTGNLACRNVSSTYLLFEFVQTLSWD